MSNPFQTRTPYIDGNAALREPQQLAHAALVRFADDGGNEREVGIVLPVGCGKSGCIALAPFAFRAKRALVIAPGLKIASQLYSNYLDPSQPSYFYKKCGVLEGPPYPEPVEIRGTSSNRSDLDEAHVIVTNIQQLQGEENRWLATLPADFFDLILFDEGHHSVATTWELLKARFPGARIVNYSATPVRADGQTMAGRIIYSYPVFRAIQNGYIKQLKALVLNPRTLKYVRRQDGQEIEVALEEVRRLGEEDADFRRAVVTSKETLDTIVNASLRELDRIRTASGDSRHKIIASALNYEHCAQVVEAYRARNRRAAFVHSREGAGNEKVFGMLERHELDVIVQVRKLGEGFDHPYLSVAAVFSIFANLSPFVQFVGRIMRVVPGDRLNRGTVVFHAGANVARRWTDFQTYSEADQDFFQQLLPMEGLDFSSADEIEVNPTGDRPPNTVEVRGQTSVGVEEIPLITNDEKAQNLLRALRELGYSPEEVKQGMEELEPIPTTKAAERRAKRAALDMRVRNEAGRILRIRQVNPAGRELDKQYRGRENFVVVKAAIDRQINDVVGRAGGDRSEFSRPELDTIESRFSELVAAAEREVFGG